MKKNSWRNVWLMILILFLLPTCQQPEKTFVIEGTLPSVAYDGEKIYLVPSEGPHPRQVDSVIIENARFRFSGTKEQVCIIRTRPMLRMTLQELLVVTESGLTTVTMDSISSAEGTPQNNALQGWKEHLMEYNRLSILYVQRRKLSAEDSLHAIRALDSLQKKDADYQYLFLKEQGANTLGRFIYKMRRHVVDSLRRVELDTVFQE